MRSWRFLLTPRWVVFALVVLALAALAWRLGEWQFHRLEERRERNALIEQHAEGPPRPVGEILGVGEPVAADEEWQQVRARGRYAPGDTVIVRYRTRDGRPGASVVVPLETAGGPTLLVDRGWVPTENRGGSLDPAEIPAPPSGTVTVRGWVRANGTGPSTTVTDGSTRAISSATIGDTLDEPLYTGFVELVAEEPPPAERLEPHTLPELDDGPHFFYGLQWWFFGLLALTGFGWLVRDERRGRTGRRGSRGRQSERSMPPSTGTSDPETNDAAGESRKQATRPSSSGSP